MPWAQPGIGSRGVTPEVTIMVKHLLRTALAVPVIAGTLASCSTPYVKSDVNTALIGTVRCNTYAWAGSFRGNSPLRNTVASPLNESRLRAAIAANLRVGIQPAPGNADCLIGYGIGARNVVQDAWPDGWGYSYYPGWGYWGYPGPYVYHEGIISVDLFDARSRQPLWHASADQSLYGVSGPEAEKRIAAAVAAIFAKYPYRG
jgi:hypothetical protein